MPPVPSLWRDRRFRRLWSAQTVSQFGDRVSEIAMPLIAATTLRASVNEVAWLTALIWTPNLLGILFGAWVDQRVHKRRLMMAADLVRALVLSSLPAAYLAGELTLAQLYAVALVTGMATLVFNTSDRSFFAHLVPARVLRRGQQQAEHHPVSLLRGWTGDRRRSRSGTHGTDRRAGGCSPDGQHRRERQRRSGRQRPRRRPRARAFCRGVHPARRHGPARRHEPAPQECAVVKSHSRSVRASGVSSWGR